MCSRGTIQADLESRSTRHGHHRPASLRSAHLFEHRLTIRSGRAKGSRLNSSIPRLDAQSYAKEVENDPEHGDRRDAKSIDREML
jgi:hypothetical protein